MNPFVYYFRQIKKFPDWVFWFPAKFLMLWRRTCKLTILDEGGSIVAKNPPGITVTWHNRLLFFPVVFDRWQREHSVAVISASRDGEYIAALCRQFSVESVRGSSKRQAVQALVGAAKSILQRRKYVCFTPDGPRGPKYRMSRGPIFLAKETGEPIYPIAINYSSYWELKSWDGFQIPKPFCKVELHVGQPIRIPHDVTEEQMEEWRVKVEQILKSITIDKK